MRDFKELNVWKKAFEFTKDIYKITENFPKSEIYGITSQLRRASVSISSNIAEGCGKLSERDFLNFLVISFGSSKEVENLLLLCKELNYINITDFNSLNQQLTETSKMLNAFISNIKKGIREVRTKC